MLRPGCDMAKRSKFGCHDDADGFDRALKKVASAPPPMSVKKRKKAKKK
jgi:hypothetical protein